MSCSSKLRHSFKDGAFFTLSHVRDVCEVQYEVTGELRGLTSEELDIISSKDSESTADQATSKISPGSLEECCSSQVVVIWSTTNAEGLGCTVIGLVCRISMKFFLSGES
ncbi:hypothetical protein OGAPHI_000659 [Ogataea philodendri]|uniref:Uncharacterized protein n=1 Tax=Ogataea philodendri TaxID=1378263 RepID=A0A9P8PES9_9ASCO|nr:uncharacterized protein OGAPHI_000659 [Ogataea philodendri]KAH3670948.1 hypothetical protein OGAPHI_000659 [Ogataea philodendri]